MATTAILHANEMHQNEPSSDNGERCYLQSSTSFSPGNFAHPERPSSSGASTSNVVSYQQQYASSGHNVQRNIYQNLTPEPAPSDGTVLELGANQSMQLSTSTPTNANITADVLTIRDPFDEFPRRRPPFLQRPPAYINTGNPIHGGGQFDLPRNLRVQYPDSAFQACAAANRNLANYLASVNAAQAAAQSGNGQQRLMPPFVPCGMQLRAPQTQPQPYGTPTHVQVLNQYGPTQPAGPPGQMMYGPSTTRSPSPQTANSMAPMAYGIPPRGSVPPCLAAGQAPAPNSPSSPHYRYYNPTAAYSLHNIQHTQTQQQIPAGKKQAASHKRKSNKAVSEPQQPKNLRTVDAGTFNEPTNGLNPALGPVGAAVRSLNGCVPQAPCYLPPAGSANGPMTSNNFRYSSYENPQGFETAPHTVPGPCEDGQQQNMMGTVMSSHQVRQTNGCDVGRRNFHNNEVSNNITNVNGGGHNSGPSKAGMTQEGFVRANTDLPQEQSELQQMRTVTSPLFSAPPMSTSGVSEAAYSSLDVQLQHQRSCTFCKEDVTTDRPGIQCTASGKGCLRFFHQECSQLLPEAFHAMRHEPCAEWICNDCSSRQNQKQPIAYG